MRIDECEYGKDLFEDLEPGDIFEHQRTMYMRIPSVSSKTSHVRNAVRCMDGALHFFKDGDAVTPKPEALLYPNGRPSASDL